MVPRLLGCLPPVALVAWATTLGCVVPPAEGRPWEDDPAEAAGSSNPGSPPGAGGGGSGSPAGAGPATDPSDPTCPYEGPPPIDPSLLPPCPGCAAGAHCVPGTMVPADVAGALADCDAKNKCVPDTFIATNGLFIPTSCDSVVGAEGRCLSVCLPQVEAQAAALPQSSCHDDERCVPCYDPFTGEGTGACELSCDPGPTELPTVLPKCCFGLGTCVPASLVPAQAVGFLKQDQCPGGGQGLVCAPDVFIADPSYAPEPCETGWLSTLLGDEYRPGVCLPRCLAGPDSSLLSQDGCPAFHTCTPCLDPESGKPSGACDL
jgi:hypothetical protein